MAKKKENNRNNNYNSKNANYKNQKANTSKNKENTAKKEEFKKKYPSNAFVMQVCVFLGVIFLSLSIVYLMNYFFVEHNDIKINMSTDKKLEYINISGKDELITTQKYVSDLDYSMRYDINNISVFKYKSQDIFKFINADKILVVVEKSKMPSNCTKADLDLSYTSCTIKLDNYTDEYYLSTKDKTYKITVKTPNTSSNDRNIKSRIEYMLQSFEMKA